ncbi:hypothetical protein Z948_2873 [Sulfitobacter donghicola DSW-25 = KCTC 12864 = JCM 14565]|uniref:Aspartate/glutamate racemase family protein n=2 Tax=Sulfitobacter TaxID=60136 RepID=A0A073IHR1_9RHOB|nr:hypothetical protein [Sulfitobacter donghicola]KEJ89329.1 hypothetical protein DSW25_09945 [Sulfitobacter donghicola DSW-25 = KCTC 12864 = JCM 14565]KIN69135.1 hypothetical protein Z948_2873 [Sulfitobacter donghicola DSW-25 = KCTC 12864 = JCM 14565]
MTPRVTVLQLDTDFPRIPGDVGAVETYSTPPQIIRIAGASVGKIVIDRPEDIDITPFADALAQAEGDVIATSCGFLAFWQDHLAALTDRPFVASSLIALDGLSDTLSPEELMILTFDESALGTAHLRGHDDYSASILGLAPQMHLRQVISQNQGRLNPTLAGQEIVSLVATQITKAHKHILLECTNLPPYRRALQQVTGLPVTDILSVIEETCPNAIAPAFIS